jgi:hypothetical protein
VRGDDVIQYRADDSIIIGGGVPLAHDDRTSLSAAAAASAEVDDRELIIDASPVVCASDTATLGSDGGVPAEPTAATGGAAAACVVRSAESGSGSGTAAAADTASSDGSGGPSTALAAALAAPLSFQLGIQRTITSGRAIDQDAAIPVDLAPFHVSDLTSMPMLHFLFAICGFGRIYVTWQGRLVGIIFKNDFLSEKWLTDDTMHRQ